MSHEASWLDWVRDEENKIAFDKKKGPRVNEQIRPGAVRLIGPEGGQLGVVSREEALAKASEYGLDLLELNSDAAPPVVKILDWDKFRYDLTKKEQEQRKKNKPKEVKTVKISLKIGQHDLENKVRQATEFLQKGHRVKLSLFFRGREMTHQELGQVKIEEFIKAIADHGDVEDRESRGREIITIIVPKKNGDHEGNESKSQQ